MNKTHKLNRMQFLTKLTQSTGLLACLASERNFGKAAEKLGVHQSALSHRLKQLEEYLGFAVFDRTTRQLSMTAQGEILCEAALANFDRWHSAFDALENFKSENTIRLSVSSSLAMKFLLPILPDAAEQGLDISLDVNDSPSDFGAGMADVAIRFGVGPYPGLHSTRLCKSSLFPVAGVNYSKGYHDLAQLERTQPLVFLSDRAAEQDQTQFTWAHYLSNHPIKIKQAETIKFDRADLMIQGAISGMGVGLGRTLIVEKDIKDGFLRPMGPPVQMDASYWLVCPPNFAQTDRYQLLFQWLKEKVSDLTMM